MKAAVTGATGFIGGKLAEALVNEGYGLKCLVRKTSNTEKLKSLGVELMEGDLGSSEALEKLPGGADIVFHLAALVSDWGRREDFTRYNVEATRTLLDAAKDSGVKRFIHMSSSTVIWKSDFWNIHNLVDVDETYPYPESYNDNYNATKAEAEKLVLRCNEPGVFETVVIRPSNVWGAGDTVLLPRIAAAAVKGVLIPMGGGSRTVTPCHVNNLTQALILAVNNDKAPGNIFFINDGVKTSYMDFVKAQLRSSGIDWKPKFSIPYKLAYSMAAVLEVVFKLMNSKRPPVLTRFAVAALAGSRSYSIEKAKRELGYIPDTDTEKGLKEMEDWVSGIGGTKALLEYA